MSMTNPLQRGFTLIELIIFIVVVSAGLAGILSVMNTVVKSSADPMVRKQTIAIAESMLEEILLKDATDPNGGTNGRSDCLSGGAAATRATWDDVCDYQGYATTTIVDLTGAGAGLANYSVVVAVDRRPASSSDLTDVAALKVTVTVTHAPESVNLIGYRTCYGETDSATGSSRCP